MEIATELLTTNQVLTYRSLVRIAASFGWTEAPDRGRGSHHCLVQEGYRPIVLTCHGESTEFQRGISRRYLKAIMEPVKNMSSVDSEALQANLEKQLADLHAQLQQEGQQWLADVQKTVTARIEAYETEQLEACNRTIASLVAEKTGFQVQEIQCLKQDLATWQAAYREQQQRVQAETTTGQFLEAQLRNTQTQVTQLRASRDRYRWATWLSLGLATCLSAAALQPWVTQPQQVSPDQAAKQAFQH